MQRPLSRRRYSCVTQQQQPSHTAQPSQLLLACMRASPTSASLAMPRLVSSTLFDLTAAQHGGRQFVSVQRRALGSVEWQAVQLQQFVPNAGRPSLPSGQGEHSLSMCATLWKCR